MVGPYLLWTQTWGFEKIWGTSRKAVVVFMKLLDSGVNKYVAKLSAQQGVSWRGPCCSYSATVGGLGGPSPDKVILPQELLSYLFPFHTLLFLSVRHFLSALQVQSLRAVPEWTAPSPSSASELLSSVNASSSLTLGTTSSFLSPWPSPPPDVWIYKDLLRDPHNSSGVQVLPQMFSPH